jgi:hypothetical protein
MAIQNPNSSGQGFDPDHKDNPHYATLLKHGYVYSHSTPVRHQSGIVNHHTYKHPDLKDHVVGVYKPSKMNSHVWSTSKLGGSKYEGQGDAALDKHLKGHIARAKRKSIKENLSPVEELLRQKLSYALNEEKRRVAVRLFELIQPAATAPQTPGTTNTTTTGAPKNNQAAGADKKKAKMDQINSQRAKLQALQSKTSSAKDPNAMRAQIQAQQQKLTAMQQELTGIK